MLLRLIDFPIEKILIEKTHGKAFSFKTKTKTVKTLANIGVNTVSDLLRYYPRNYQDRRDIVPLTSCSIAPVCTIVTVLSHQWIGFKKGRQLKITVEDESGTASLVCFNRPWLGKKLLIGERYWLWGNFKYFKREIQSGTFDFEPYSKNSGFNRIQPVYPLTKGLYQDDVRKLTAFFLEKYADIIEDELPLELIEKYKFLTKKNAIKTVHYPDSYEELAAAKNTLIYEELFYLEMMIAKRTLERKSRKTNSVQIRKIDFTKMQKQLIERLTFNLTEGQNNAVMEINTDMLSDKSASSGIPMSRLLQGDVGSGKTLVSFLAALYACERGEQTAIIAPTELLARQHAENAARLLEPLGISIAFLTGNIKSAGRKELLKNLENGSIDIAVGTHALFSKDVKYKKLNLVIIDEQHRFGVTQRAFIMSKGENPHLLMMSATPIPRTLAMTVFGDMDVSVIRDMPTGRKPIITHLAKESNEKRVYDFIHSELSKGRQAYFVYPLIEDGDNNRDIKDAVSMAHRLEKEIFPAYRTALIHSKLTEEEKRKTMEDFRKGEIQILAATSVVEVGVDVPNATCMVIESAQQFGLSALHQLRGRVGRGEEQSYCFLIYSEDYTKEAAERLKIMHKTNDGFLIAQEDLKLRGPGLITGTEQSGFFDLGIADLIRDHEMLENARSDAFEILENDSGLVLADHRIIAKVLEEAPPFPEVAL